MNKTIASTTKTVLALAVALSLALVGCSGSGDSGSDGPSEPDAAVDLTRPEALVDDVDWEGLPSTEVTLDDDGLAITEAGTYVLTGSSTGQVTADVDGDLRIVLDGVTIDSAQGAAIHIDNADLAVLELAEGSENTVTDSATRDDESIDGAIFSRDDLLITGEGRLAVDGKFDDGIVGKDDLTIEAGTFEVGAVDDGIRGKDSLVITGGDFTITADDDGLKSSNENDAGDGQVVIAGGDITIDVPDKAIEAQEAVWVTGGRIDVQGSFQGIRAPIIVIDDGDISIAANDDGINASDTEAIPSGFSITINGGSVTVVMNEHADDGIDSKGDLTITGGTVDVTGESPFNIDGDIEFTGGTVTANGEEVDEIPNS